MDKSLFFNTRLTDDQAALFYLGQEGFLFKYHDAYILIDPYLSDYVDKNCCTDCCNTGWLESPDAEFAQLWDKTIKPTDLDNYGWEANPWVWVIEFERCEKPDGWAEL